MRDMDFLGRRCHDDFILIIRHSLTIPLQFIQFFFNKVEFLNVFRVRVGSVRHLGDERLRETQTRGHVRCRGCDGLVGGHHAGRDTFSRGTRRSSSHMMTIFMLGVGRGGCRRSCRRRVGRGSVPHLFFLCIPHFLLGSLGLHHVLESLELFAQLDDFQSHLRFLLYLFCHFVFPVSRRYTTLLVLTLLFYFIWSFLFFLHGSQYGGIHDIGILTGLWVSPQSHGGT
mmetsp:Transcript_5800/g.11330  ORF Transcript_5800/g.11330 Transcript_5800/m.11330 type:complete len:227 (-) Transcript_5800:1289-1969(-)